MESIKTDDIIRNLLCEKCEALEQKLSAEILLLSAPMMPGVDDIVRREIENIASRQGRRDRLAIVLETSGGSIEVVERINDVFRHHFNSVVFVIPNFAYSAGTVLVMSGDAIYMDYYSILGPIDPQIQNKDGRWVPGLGYLDHFDKLVEKSKNGQITTAELEFMIRKFDPAELFALEQAKTHSAELIKKWLCAYKFKNWDKRETTGGPVCSEYKSDRAQKIADMLGDPNEWNSHGRGISLEVLQSDKIGLKINNFGKDPELNKSVREYYDLFVDYCAKIGVGMATHSKARFQPFGGMI